jgi:aspartate kinase
MQEMSEAGAKVLNAQAVQFAKEAQIAIYARSTFQQGRETIVRKFPSGLSKGVKAVVYENDISKIEYFNNDDEKSISLLRFLEQRQIPIKEFNYSKVENGNKISFLVSEKNIYNVEKIESELTAEFGNCLKIEHGFGTVSLIGDGINKDNTILLETLSILQKEKVKIHGVATTSFRISFLLEKALVKNTVLLYHNRWIEEKV